MNDLGAVFGVMFAIFCLVWIIVSKVNEVKRKGKTNNASKNESKFEKESLVNEIDDDADYSDFKDERSITEDDNSLTSDFEDESVETKSLFQSVNDSDAHPSFTLKEHYISVEHAIEGDNRIPVFRYTEGFIAKIGSVYRTLSATDFQSAKQQALVLMKG